MGNQEAIVTLVRDVIARPPVEVVHNDPLRYVASTLTEESIGAVVVRGPHPEDSWGVPPWGIVSERDIVAAIADGADPDTMTAEMVMTTELAFATPAEPLTDAIRSMLDNEIRHLPVVEDGIVVGVVSARDALAALSEPTRRSAR